MRNKTRQFVSALSVIAFSLTNVGSAFCGDSTIERAEKFYLQGDHRSALKELEEGESADPKDIRVLKWLGAAYEENAQYDKAIVMYEKVVQANPADSFTRTSLGNLYYTKGDLSRSKDMYMEAVKASPDFNWAIVALAGYYSAVGDPVNAVKNYAKAYNGGYRTPTMIKSYADALLDQGMYEKAAALYEAELKDGTNLNDYVQASIHGNLGIVYSQMKGGKEKSIEHFEKAASYNFTSQSSVLMWLIEAYAAQGQYDKCIEAGNKFIKTGPPVASSYTTLGYCYLKEKKVEEARIVLLKALDLNPSGDNAKRMLAEIDTVKSSVKSLDAKLTDLKFNRLDRGDLQIYSNLPVVEHTLRADLIKRDTEILTRQLGIAVAVGPVRVYIFKDSKSYNHFLLDSAKDLSIEFSPYGMSLPSEKIILLNLEKGDGTFLHEFVHLLMHEHFTSAPYWLAEGLPALYEVATVSDNSIRAVSNWRLRELKKAMTNKSLIPMRELISGDLDKYAGDGRHAPVAQARYLLLYLQDHGSLELFLKKFAASKSEDPSGAQTLESVSGHPIEMLEADWLSWIKTLK